MVKIILILLVMLVCISCSSSKPSPEEDSKGSIKFINVNIKWENLPQGTPFLWNQMDGFFSSNDHKYGFDKHTNPRNKEDSVVHISVAKNDDWAVDVKIDRTLANAGYEYSLHYLQTKDSSNISDSKTLKRKADASLEKITLNRKSGYGSSNIQELWIHPYERKIYNFTAAYFKKDDDDETNKLVFSREFWTGFNNTYQKAIVSYNSLSVYELKLMQIDYDTNGNVVKDKYPKNYLLTRVRDKDGDTLKCRDIIGDISLMHKSLLIEMEKNPNFPRRAIIQLGLPTKKFWALQKKNDERGSIDICGNPEEQPSKTQQYDVLSIAENCRVPKATMSWNNRENIWYMEWGGVSKPATGSDIPPNCAVMAEKSIYPLGSQYVGEFGGSNTRASTWFSKVKEKSTSAVVILPWYGFDSTGWVAYHELGHTMGLSDVEDLPNLDKTSDQGNQMFHSIHTGSILRYRNMNAIDKQIYPPNYFERKESQWDCLHRLPSSDPACADPSKDF